jgi:hypothetical protein
MAALGSGIIMRLAAVPDRGDGSDDDEAASAAPAGPIHAGHARQRRRGSTWSICFVEEDQPGRG